LQKLQGGRPEHAATIAYQLSDVQLHDGCLYKRAMKLPLTAAKVSGLRTNTLSNQLSNQTEKHSEAALACTFSGNRYFGHWMTDDVTLTLAAQQIAEAIRTSQELTAHQVDYSNLLEIAATPVHQAYFKRLIVIQDFGQNQFKRERYEYIRSKLRTVPSRQSGQKVMLLRGNSGVRRSLVNETEIAEFLSSHGFIIVDPQRLSVNEILFETLGAEIIVGVEGSQLAHGLFALRAAGTILTLQPPNRFNNVFKDYTDCLGLNYSFVVGNPVAGGFEIRIEDLVRTLDMVSQVWTISLV